MAHSLKSVRHLLKDKPTLNHIEREIDAQQLLLQRVRDRLPGDLAGHCIAARISAQRLVLHADSPVWASRLRFLSAQLPSLLQQDYPSLREVKIKLFLERRIRDPRRNVARRSDSGAAIIHETAKDTQHPQLRAALERLANAVKRER